MLIDKNIENDSEFIADLELSQLRLYKDGDLDWFLLVPRLEDVKDWDDLTINQQFQLTKEINYACKLLKRYGNPDKINVGSLGNMVPQMHIHIIARKKNDRAWPGAIWGTKSKKNYQDFMACDWKKRINES